jgi:maltose O-acetyltransferase
VREAGGSRALHRLRLLVGHPGHVLREVLGAIRGTLVLRARERGARVRILGALQIVRDGQLRVGARSTFVGGMLPTLLAVRDGGSLELGENTFVNYGSTLEARRSITVGARCLLGSMVRVVDHRDGKTAPIVIGDDVWLAHGVVIEPGVSIGSGSVVAAGTVVHEDVPSGSLVSGSPARAKALTGTGDV